MDLDLLFIVWVYVKEAQRRPADHNFIFSDDTLRKVSAQPNIYFLFRILSQCVRTTRPPKKRALTITRRIEDVFIAGFVMFLSLVNRVHLGENPSNPGSPASFLSKSL